MTDPGSSRPSVEMSGAARGSDGTGGPASCPAIWQRGRWVSSSRDSGYGGRLRNSTR
jgi:hypothetical protein